MSRSAARVPAPIAPRASKLPGGTSLEDLQVAVEMSGYPLQLAVADVLKRRRFSVEDEWTFVDRTSGLLRAIDLSARISAVRSDIARNLRVRPSLRLLVECKRSDMPYVFFRATGTGTLFHPHVTGTRRQIRVHTSDDWDTYDQPLAEILELPEHPYAYKVPFLAATFSKARRAGRKLELSGDEAYHGLVLPLVSARDHFDRISAPSAHASHFQAHLVIQLGVVEAPMFVADLRDAGVTLQAAPWVRVVRTETGATGQPSIGLGDPTLHLIDVVHVDYLDKFLARQVIPLARFFGSRVAAIDEVIATGEGVVRALPSTPTGWRRLRPWMDEDDLARDSVMIYREGE